MVRVASWSAVGLAALIALGGCALFRAAQRPAADAPVASTPVAVARGAYVVKHLAACMSCHSPLDEQTYQPKPGLVGAGGRRFGGPDAPFELYSANLTSDAETGLGRWSDGEIMRALREGVSRDGQALFPVMPYHNFRHMSDADAEAVVAYLRTLPPVKNPVPERRLGFPLNLAIHTMPRPLAGPVAPPAGEAIAQGRYVWTMASCADCHSPMTNRGPDLSRPGAGGMSFPGEKPHGAALVAPNITPDEETGIGKWTDTQIANAIRFGQRPDGSLLHPVMPWPQYNGLSEDDVRSLVTYMRTLSPVRNEVEQPARK